MKGDDRYGKTVKLCEFLKQHPKGVTAKQAAALLQWPDSTTTSLLSRLAAYNVIARKRDESYGSGKKYLYTMSAQPHAKRRLSQAELEQV